jgi:hypothetical protein
VSRRVNLEKWLHVSAGCYKTKDGRASIFKVGPNDWATQVGPSGRGKSVGNGHTAAIAALFVENALDEEDSCQKSDSLSVGVNEGRKP